MATEQLVKAIYLTLLHSLWQGAFVAGLAGVIMICTKRSSSAFRYNLLAGSMLLFVLCTIVTFTHYSNTLSEATALTEIIPAHRNLNPQASQFSTIDKVLSSIYSYSNSIVLIWFVIICLKSFQLALGLHRVSNLKKQSLIDPGVYWTERVNILSDRLRIRAVVKFAESGLTAIPLTVGYLKPIILVPAGMLAAIPSEQIEAILLHELAHIKRKDYFVNIFQSLIEVLYFFNPAIWWLSSLLRAERENCCDDIAIANSSSKTNYVRALISFEEYRQQLPQLAVAFTGNESNLIKRTRRIIHNQNNTLNAMEKFILTSGLILSGLVGLAFTDGGKEQISKTLKPVVSTIAENFPIVERAFPVQDTVLATADESDSAITYNSIRNGIPYRIIVKNSKVDELYVSNIQVPRNRISEYTKITTEIIELAESSLIAAKDEKRQAEQSKIAFAALNPRPEQSISNITEQAISTINNTNKIIDIVLIPPAIRVAPDKPNLENKDHGNMVSYTAEDSIITDVSGNNITLYSKDKITEITIKTAKNPNFKAKPQLLEQAPNKPLVVPAEMINEPLVVPAKVIKDIHFENIPAKNKQADPVHKAKTVPAEEIKEPLVVPAKVIKDVQFKATPLKNKPTNPSVQKARTVPAEEIKEPTETKPVKNERTAPKVLKAVPLYPKKKAISPDRPPMGFHKPETITQTHTIGDQIGKELINEGLVKDPTKFSYKITNNDLFINGIKQSESIQRCILSKLTKKENDRIDFTYTM